MRKTLRKITPEQAKQMIADERFCPGIDERLGRMVGAAMQRKIRVRYLSVHPATLVAHVPKALAKAKVHLMEEPSLRESVLRELLEVHPPALLTFRTENGALCSFDDYLRLAVAQDAKVQQVRVVVLGEGNEWYKLKESPVLLG